tara:strand:- start:1292 stop:1870 length:579 start_codon:yes stop_codon:yes gene_type:complete
MKSFQQFFTEATRGEQGHQALDDYKMSKKSDTPLEVGRIGANRKKTDAEKKRVKAIGGGKTAPVDYKDRKDIGTNKERSKVEQQPQRERGTSGVSGKEAQRKAYLERKARERGEKTKTRTELLTKKTTKAVDPKYKPAKASGMTTKERQSLTRKGEKKLRDLRLHATGKTKESELKHAVTTKEIARRKKDNK